MADLESLAGRPSETLEYIHSMLGQLRSMAYAERLELVAHYIEMAYIQAGDTARGQQPTRLDDLYSSFDQRNSVA